MLNALLPPDVSMGFAMVLVVTSFFTSAITAAFGLGGGVALLAVMGMGLPSTSLVPVHGVVQFGSNFGRMFVQRLHIVRPLVGWFIIGAVIGTLIGTPFAAMLPDRVAKVALALFILWNTHRRKGKQTSLSHARFVFGGVVSSFASMIVGATGPLVSSLLAGRGLTKQPLVATNAACMVVQHFLKIVAFGVVGFAYWAWAPLIAAMIVVGFAGTVVGSRLLDKMPDRSFRTVFKVLITLLALQILWNAVAPVLIALWAS
ncbi:MAG: sulfite exporter TauE/SafE family protein [Methylobacteriaceae bacterium]|jgi:uncharacterized membrane protein YfcA|nr:sulfite exporter TauE/SafE family protein [Methylobacteriaceae bacterium]